MEVRSVLPLGRRCQRLAVGVWRALGDGEIEPVDVAVVGADQSTRARVVNVQSGLPHADYRARRAALNRGDG